MCNVVFVSSCFMLIYFFRVRCRCIQVKFIYLTFTLYYSLCHPGPCPACNAYISKFCNCGRSYQKVKCSKQEEVRCQQVCNKLRNCNKHKCTEICHSGSCASCEIVLSQGKYHCHSQSQTSKYDNTTLFIVKNF